MRRIRLDKSGIGIIGVLLAGVLLVGVATPAVRAQTATAEIAALAGDARRGQQLYSGGVAMVNGGAPCIACHALDGLGSAGMASYGPDLSSFHADYAAEGVMAVLESLAFSRMEAIYLNRPLSQQEQLDLTAFLAEIAARPAPPARSLAGMVLLAVALVFAIVALAGLHRFKGVRQSLVEQARQQRGVKS